LPTGWAATVNTEIAKTSQFFPPQFKLIADGQKQTLKCFHPMSAKDGHLATPSTFPGAPRYGIRA
jgi:hypothetical protein